jgi:cell division protein FtsL
VTDERDDFEAEEHEEDDGQHNGFGHYNFAENDFEPSAFEHDLDEHEHRHADDDFDDDIVDGLVDESDDPSEGGADADVDAKDRHPSSPAKRASWERPTRIAVGTLAVIAILFLFVFPTRSYLAQQRQVGSARHAVQVLKAQNEQLIRQKQQLQTPAEIERLAREQFNMVLPGEQAYNVLSTATTSTTAP